MKRKILFLSFLLAGSFMTLYADDFDLYLVGMESGEYTALDYTNLRSLSFTQERAENEEGTRVYVNRVFANYNDGTSVEFNAKNYSAIMFQDKAVGISLLTEKRPERSGSDALYNLQGQRVDGSYRGIVIRNGKKYLVK